jgi:AMMECR1 domain-containing protein
MILSSSDYATLIDIAKQSIRHGHRHHAPILLRPGDFNSTLRQYGSTFVSIKDGANYLGCQGNTRNTLPLHWSVQKNAYNSAFSDTRYPPLNNHWAKKCTITIHHLHEYKDYSNLSLNEIIDTIQPEDSIMVSYDGKEALMLATMQEYFKTKEKFINETISKAGITNTDYKKLNVRLYKTFATEPTNIGDLNEDQTTG